MLAQQTHYQPSRSSPHPSLTMFENVVSKIPFPPPPQPGKLGRLQSSPGLPHSSVSQSLSLQGSLLDPQKCDLPSVHDRDMWEVGSGLGGFHGSGKLALQQRRWCGSGHRTSKSHSSPRCGHGETQTVTQVLIPAAGPHASVCFRESLECML